MMKKTLTYISVIVLFFTIGCDFFSYLRLAYTDNSEISEKYDAVVVLTGGQGRIDKGIELIRRKKSDILFISGVNEMVSAKHVKNINGLDKDFNLRLGYAAHNTYENATEVLSFVKKNNIKSIILVTSAYHVPRALYELSILDTDIKITPYRVFFNGKRYKITKLFRLLISEYCKYVLVRLKRNIL